MQLIRSLVIAFSMYSSLPMPDVAWDRDAMRWSLCFFPLVGAVVGLISGLWLMLCEWLVFPVILRAAGMCLLPVLITGGIHLDGLLDTADALSSYRSVEERLEIMKDSRLGTYGALGIFCSLILKWLCIWHLPDNKFLILFALTAAAARWAMLFLLSKGLANPNGMAAMLRKHCPKRVLLYALPVPLLLALLYGSFGFLYLLIGLGSTFVLGLIAEKKIGGINGDVLGFSIELAEIVLLLAAQVLP